MGPALLAVGYYPHSLYGNGTLATKATKIAFGGEDTGQLSAKQMGSGQKANAGWQKPAYQNMIFYIDTNTTSQWANLDKYESNPDCYTTDLHDIYGNWGHVSISRWRQLQLKPSFGRLARRTRLALAELRRRNRKLPLECAVERRFWSLVYAVPIPIAITQSVVWIVRPEAQARPDLSRTEP